MLHNSWADHLFDVGQYNFVQLTIAFWVEFTRKGRETLHKVDQSVKAKNSALLAWCWCIAVLRRELSELECIWVIEPLLDWWEEAYQRHQEHFIYKWVFLNILSQRSQYVHIVSMFAAFLGGADLRFDTTLFNFDQDSVPGQKVAKHARTHAAFLALTKDQLL